MALNTSIERQFEFLQQQWINYANDSKEGNDKDVLLGNHNDPHGACPTKMVIHADPKSGRPPYFVNQIPAWWRPAAATISSFRVSRHCG